MDFDFAILLNSLNPYVFLSALVLTLLVAVFFFGRKGRDRYHGLLRQLSNHFNFKTYWLTGIVKFLYALIVLTAVCSGVYTLFCGHVLMGALSALVAPIVARLFFEVVMTLLSVREESAYTNDYLREMLELQKKPLGEARRPSEAPAARADKAQ